MKEYIITPEVTIIVVEITNRVWQWQVCSLFSDRICHHESLNQTKSWRSSFPAVRYWIDESMNRRIERFVRCRYIPSMQSKPDWPKRLKAFSKPLSQCVWRFTIKSCSLNWKLSLLAGFLSIVSCRSVTWYEIWKYDQWLFTSPFRSQTNLDVCNPKDRTSDSRYYNMDPMYISSKSQRGSTVKRLIFTVESYEPSPEGIDPRHIRLHTVYCCLASYRCRLIGTTYTTDGYLVGTIGVLTFADRRCYSPLDLA